MNEQTLKHDDEIELIDIFFLIWRWKVFIASVTSLVTIVVVVYMFFAPSLYYCSMLLKPTGFIQDNLNIRYVAKTKTIESLISSKALNPKIIDHLKINREYFSQNGLRN